MAVSRLPFAIVTGANQGIGFEIARSLGRQGYSVLMTSRDLAKGAEAALQLKADGAQVNVLQLDITDAESIKRFSRDVANACPEGVAVLVNNAGFAYKGDIFGASEARVTIACNYYGTRQLTDALLPVLRLHAGSRIINVCSTAGKLKQVSAALQERFSSPTATADSIRDLCEEFIAAVTLGDFRARGWPGSMYGVSKVSSPHFRAQN